MEGNSPFKIEKEYIDLTRNVQNLYEKNCKILLKEISKVI